MSRASPFLSPTPPPPPSNDNVSIRPLQTAEVRARTLTGRLQISQGGERLLDGVRYGRPVLRAPNPNHRPPVRIPPPKRQKLLTDTSDGIVNEGSQSTALIASGGVDQASASPRTIRKTAKTVHFEIGRAHV